MNFNSPALERFNDQVGATTTARKPNVTSLLQMGFLLRSATAIPLTSNREELSMLPMEREDLERRPLDG